MAQISFPWPDTSPAPFTGDGQPYTDRQWCAAWRAAFQGANAEAGILATDPGGDLPDRFECSTPAANEITVTPGAAFVDGCFYMSDANETLTPASAGAGTIRHDRVVIRGSWGAGAEQYTARLYVKTGDHVAPPALTQVRNTTWELSVCRYQIDEHGDITNIVDEREWARYPMLPEITTEMLVDGILSADAAGRAKMADGFFTAAILAKFAAGFFTANADGRGKFADGIWTTAKLIDGILSADAAGRAKMADNFLAAASLAKIAANTFTADADGRGKFADGIWTTAKYADNSVDETKTGNRVVNLHRRQGSSATAWSTAGVTDYTPTLVRSQAGSAAWSGAASSSGDVDITFPVPFAYAPLVFVTGTTGDNVFVAVGSPLVTTTGFRAYWRTITGANITTMGFNWLAIGPE